MPLSDYTFVSLHGVDELNGFDCEDDEINEFLFEDAVNFQIEKITKEL